MFVFVQTKLSTYACPYFRLIVLIIKTNHDGRSQNCWKLVFRCHMHFYIYFHNQNWLQLCYGSSRLLLNQTCLRQQDTHHYLNCKSWNHEFTFSWSALMCLQLHVILSGALLWIMFGLAKLLNQTLKKCSMVLSQWHCFFRLLTYF